MLIAESGENIEDQVTIEIADPDLCYRYTASLITGVKIGPSPQCLKDALTRAGQRPINNVVDITNYVMLEYGQPLHAFDFDTCKDRTIIVRAAREGEMLTTLDGEQRKLSPPMLTIADSTDAVGLAGVMGGANSEMTPDTTTVLLESASFNPVNTRRTRTALDLRTDASDRFERGIRAALAPIGLRRATQLIAELCGGTAARGIIDLYPTRREPPTVRLSRARIKQVLGVDYPMSQVKQVLESLGFEEAEETGGLIDLIETVEAAPSDERSDTLWLKVPYWRSDISIEDDLVEEVARIVGYDSLPTTMLSTAVPHWQPQPMTELKERVRDLLAAAGMQETISYSPTTLENLSRVDTLDDSNPRCESPIRSAASGSICARACAPTSSILSHTTGGSRRATASVSSRLAACTFRSPRPRSATCRTRLRCWSAWSPVRDSPRRGPLKRLIWDSSTPRARWSTPSASSASKRPMSRLKTRSCSPAAPPESRLAAWTWA